MLKREFYRSREDGVKLFRTYSDKNMKIQKDGTEELYSEAIDVENSGFSYTETEIPIPADEEITVADAIAMLGELGVDTDDNED